MTAEQLEQKAKGVLKHLAHVQVSQFMDLDMMTMRTGPTRIEVSYDAVSVIGRCPAGKEAREEWKKRRLEVATPAMEEAKKALRKARVKFREYQDAGNPKLILNGGN